MSTTTETPSTPKGAGSPSSTNSTDIVKDVYLWRRWKMSGAVLLASTAVWVVMEVYQFNFITVSSWLAMFLVSTLYIWGNILRRLRKEEQRDMSWLQVPEQSAIGVANCIRRWGEEGVRWMLRIGAEKEWFVFAATVAALWILSVIGNCSDLLTLLYFGNAVGMIMPAIYVRYEYKIKEYIERLKMQCKRLHGMVDEKVVQKLKNKAAVGSKKDDKKVE